MATRISTTGDNIRVTIIMTPNPGKMDEVMAIVQEGIEHHQAHVPACLNWVATKSLDLGKARTGQEELTEEIVVVEEWTSFKALMEHGQTEWAQGIRSKMDEITPGFIFRISKPVGGFTRN